MKASVRRGKRLDSGRRDDPLAGLSIGILCGGPSAEREVSLQSGEAVTRALAQKGHAVRHVVLDEHFGVPAARALGLDVAFLALHGAFGEDGQVQAILEQAGIPYTGSGPEASAVAFDKVQTKLTYEKNGLLTPAWMSLERESMEPAGEAMLDDWAPPLVVKPAASGSSLGVTIVRQPGQASEALRRARACGGRLLVERYIPGRELTVAVLGEEPLPVAELQLAGEFYDYHAKYEDEATGIVCPASLPRRLAARAQASALAAHLALGCRDLSRTDMILDEDGRLWVLETNTLPGLTAHSLLPRSSESVGIGLAALCEKLLRRAWQRKSGKNRQAA